MNLPDRPVVLVVDDVAQNIDVLRSVLGDRYRIRVAVNGRRALAAARAEPRPSLILLDIMMPEMDGYAVCRNLKSDYRTAVIPVIFVTALDEVVDEARGFDAGAVDYITKPISPALVKARVRTHIALHDQTRHLESLVAERTEQLRHSQLQFIQMLGRAAEYKDENTGQHVIRMSHYARILGLQAGMEPADAEMLLHAAPMHDIGKIGIPDRILLKPGRLDAEERAVMREHCVIGARILGEHADNAPLLAMARDIALHHHECWDGTGYPAGVAGDRIPLVARIVTIVDVFDALTSERPYKAAWPVERALAQLRRKAGRQFDPQLVDRFHDAMPSIMDVFEAFQIPSTRRPEAGMNVVAGIDDHH